MSDQQGNQLASRPSEVVLEVVVRDKDGNVKYQGPWVLQTKEPDHGRNA